MKAVSPIKAFLPGALLLQLLFAPTLLGQQIEEIPDLVAFKQAVKAYHDSGRYEEDIRQVVRQASAYLQGRLGGGGKLAIVLDIDETSLSNWPQLVNIDFGFFGSAWNAWVDKGEAWAIGPTLDLFNYARSQGVAVFFITGRTQSQSQATEENLRKAGYDGWAAITYVADGTSYSFAASYKSAARKAIAEQGYTIVLSIGDQQSDLSGGYAERGFKLPNPFYLIP